MSAPGRRKRRGLQIWLSLLAIVILGWTLFPVYYMLLLSFTPTDDLFQPGLYVEHPTVRNYTYTMGADNPFVRYFWHQIGNSLVVALWAMRSEEHTSELQSHSDLVCRLLLEKKKRHHPGAMYEHHRAH